MSDRPHYGSPVAARLNELEDEIRRLHEEIRIREESQIPMIPRGAQQKMERLEAEIQRLHGVLERRDELIEAEIQRLRNALKGEGWGDDDLAELLDLPAEKT